MRNDQLLHWLIQNVLSESQLSLVPPGGDDMIRNYKPLEPKTTPAHDEVWITKEGREILVGHMDETHVRNTLRLLLRQRRKLREALNLSPTKARMLSLLLRPHLRRLEEAETAARIADEERFYRELENEVFGDDKKWGSD